MDVRGSSGELAEQTLRITPGEGAKGTQVYYGTLDYCNAVKAEALATRSGVSIDLDYSQPPLCKLTIYSPDFPDESTDGIIATTFELHGNQQQKSVFEHPNFIALDDNTQKAIRQAVDDRDYSALGTGALKFYRWAIQDVPLWTAQFVYRVSQVVSSRATVSVAFANTKKLHTTAAILGETNPPAELFWSASAAYASLDDTVPDGWALAWYKQTPTITGTAGRKFTIQLEYVLDLYPIDLYGGSLINA
jgi:hypothetical protein